MSTSQGPVIMGRPAESTRKIVVDLRGRIVTGRLAPGEQLPTRLQIEQEFGAGKATVQRALEQLRRDGFVEVNGKQGTYVSENPPHLTRYAIAFPKLPTQRAWNKFWTGLSNQVIALERSHERPSGLRLPIYYGVDGSAPTSDLVQLEEDVLSHRVAGIIFMSDTFPVAHTSLMQATGVPRVAIAGRREADIPLVNLDHDGFQARAMAHLASRGRRNVAVLSPPMRDGNDQNLRTLAAAHGMQMRPFWLQTASQQTPEAAHNIVHLLFHQGQEVRPDALIIEDDNLVNHALAGLIEAGVSVPTDVEVVTHCNFPYHEPSILPVQRIGFDARQIIAACIESIDRQRQGLPVPDRTVVAALLSQEVAEG